MFTSRTRQHSIDLTLPEGLRWEQVLRSERPALRRVIRASIRQFGEVPAVARRWVGRAFRHAYSLSDGRYVGEMEAIARAAGVTTGEIALGSAAYELNHAGWWASATWHRVLGCTAGVRQLGSGGPIHVRTLDWELDGLGEGTRIFRFREGSREFVAVGVLGFVGVLSGMVPGEWSASINWAPPVGRPRFDWGPAFLLRETLEECNSYGSAVERLRTSPLAAGCFFVVCGAAPGQACVIERTQRAAAVRKLRGVALVQANHHLAHRLRANNSVIEQDDGDGCFLDDSRTRAEVLESRLKALPAEASLRDVASVLHRPPVGNVDTQQAMVFQPSTGEMLLRRRMR